MALNDILVGLFERGLNGVWRDLDENQEARAGLDETTRAYRHFGDRTGTIT